MIVDSIEDLNALFGYMQDRTCLVVPVLTDHQSHVSQNKISCIYVYTEDDVERLVPINHTEQLQGFSEHIHRFLELESVFVHDKKAWLQLGGNDSVYDLKTLWWCTYGETYDDSLYLQPAHHFYQRRHHQLAHVNAIIPIMQHAAMCQKIRKYAWPMIQNVKLTESYKTFNSLYPKVFAAIESAGLQVNERFPQSFAVHDNQVYTNYNYHTSTGRPSNAFRGFNFAAMNKEDGTRSAFCSRFSQGALVEMDFDAYHVRLIAKLIGYKLPEGSVHEYFGRFYFSTDTLTADQYEQSKQITFRLLYGGIDREFLAIPFFKQVNDFIWNLWNQWKKQGYIRTAIDRRTMTREHFPDMTANKLFNYYLQSLETEFSVRKLDQVLNLLQSHETCMILYTYDSVLFDIPLSEAKQVLPKIQDIMEHGNFPVKCKVGDIYSKMRDIRL
jgi:hypothetical protein